MQFRSAKGFTGAGQLGLIFVFLGAGLLLAVITQLVIGLKIMPPGIPLQNMEGALIKAMADPDNVAYARLAQISGTFFLFFIPALLYSRIANGKKIFWLGFNPYINVFQVMIGFVIIFTANILAVPLEQLSKAILVHLPSLDKIARNLELAYNEQVVALSNLKSWPEFFMALLVMAFFPALFEEVLFRGALQNLFVKWWKMPFLAIIVTSLLFSLIHTSLYLFFSRAILGFVLGLMYYRTKNIWVNVIAHFFNNAIAVATLFSMTLRKEKIDMSRLDMKMEWWFGIIAIGIIFFLFRLLERYSAKNRLKIQAREQLLLEENTANPFFAN